MYQLGYHWKDFRAIGCWDLCETLTKVQMWLKSDKNMGQNTWKNKHVYIIQSITKYSVDWQQSKGNTSPHWHCNIQEFSIVDNDKWLNDAKGKALLLFRGRTFSVFMRYLSYYCTVGLWTKLHLLMIQIGKEPFRFWSPSELQISPFVQNMWRNATTDVC
jgi:hypothetical protein